MSLLTSYTLPFRCFAENVLTRRPPSQKFWNILEGATMKLEPAIHQEDLGKARNRHARCYYCERRYVVTEVYIRKFSSGQPPPYFVF